MKQPLVALAVAAVGVVGIDILGDLTQTRPESSPPGSRTEVVFEVRTKHRRPLAPLATGLWGACQGTVSSHLVDPGVVPAAGGRFRLVVEPALGRHATRRFTGCMEDATLDKVQGDIVSMRELAPAADR